MARIRSVHPGLFTDDCFITLSMTARLLMIGLWTEADDQGVFEWKPATLKVRIFPADNMDIEGALAELETSGVILAFQVGQKKYGAVRNFRKFQRPKSPKAVHPLPDDVRRYVGLCSDEPAPVTAEVIQFPQKGETGPDEVSPFLQKGEISPQMEDGGGRMKDEKKESRSADAPTEEPVPKNYAFSGQTIRVTADQFERWRLAYPAVTDLRAALQSADDYYTENPPRNGKWFFAASKWLERDNKAALTARASRDRERGYAW